MAESLHIDGDVSGKNVNIGGTQIINSGVKSERTCPLPPENPAQFGGRDDELNDLLERLKSGQASAITAVNGQGGMGKTTLAKVVANRLYADKTVRAVLWADITREPDIFRILRGWAAYADSAFETGNQTETQVASRVKALLESVIADTCPDCESPHVLVVMDDVWENGVKIVNLLKNAFPDPYKLLITTRSQTVAGKLAPGKATGLNTLSPENAAELLKQYLGDELPADGLQTLGAALGGHPLALKLAAQRILNEQDDPGATPASTLARCTGDYERGIPAGTPFENLELEQGDDKDDSLTTTLSYSYAELNADDRQHFRALGVLAFDESFDTKLLAALWNMPSDQVEKAARRLRHLALIDPTPAEGRYGQHRLLRSYARALLTSEHEYDAAFGRYADFVIEFAKQFDELPLEQWVQLSPDLPHVDYMGAELLKQYQTHPEDEPVQQRVGDFVWNVMRYITNRPEMIATSSGEVRRGLDWLETVLAIYRTQSKQNREAITLTNIGLVWSNLGDKQKALAFYEQALVLRQQSGNKSGEAIALNNIGKVWSDLGDKQKALTFYEQALVLQKQSGDTSGDATTLGNIGMVWGTLGDKQKALDYFEQALVLRQQSGDKSGEAITLNNIGAVWDDLGDKQKALTFYEQAQLLRRQVGDKAGEAITLSNIGLVWSDLGDKQKALGYYEQALPLRRQVGDKAGEATTLNNIGAVWDDLGDKQKALTFYEQAMVLQQLVGDNAGEATTFSNIGKLWFDLGDKQKALDYFEQALPLRRQVSDKYGEAITLGNIGAVWSAMGDKRKALDYYEQALSLRRQVGDKFGEAATLNNIGKVWDDLGDKQKALNFYGQVLPLRRQIGDKSGESVTSFNISMIFYNEGNLNEAIRHLERCVELEEHLQHPDHESDRQLLKKWKVERDNRKS